MKPCDKKCPKCGDIKNKSEFSKNSTLKDGLDCWCKVCANLNNKKYHAKNKDRVNESRRKKYHSKEGKAKYKKRYKLNRSNKLKYNKKYYDANQEKLTADKRRYRQTPTGKAVEKNSKHNRRQKLYKAETNSLDILKLLQSTCVCEVCNSTMEDDYNLKNSKSIDHIILISIGGKNELNNIRIICFSCNSKRPRDGRDLLKNKKYKTKYILHLKHIKDNKNKNKEYKKIFKKLEYIIESLKI